MSRKEAQHPSHEDAAKIRRAVAYLTKIGRLDPLQSAVGEDLASILDEALKTGAILRVRVKNMGTPPSEKKRAAARESLIKARQKRFGRAALDGRRQKTPCCGSCGARRKRRRTRLLSASTGRCVHARIGRQRLACAGWWAITRHD